MRQVLVVGLVVVAGGFTWWMLRYDAAPPRERSEVRDAAPEVERPLPQRAEPEPEPPPAPEALLRTAREALVRLEQKETSALAPLLGKREELCVVLHENGLIPQELLVLARLELAFNRARVEPATFADVEAPVARLKVIHRVLMESGRLSGDRAAAMERGLDALLAARDWLDSPLRLGTTKSSPAAPHDPPARDLSMLDDLNQAIVRTRERRLREERAAIRALLEKLPADHPATPETVSFRIRALLASARLGDTPWAEARARARELADAVEATKWDRRALDGLVSLFGWYGSPVLEKLYQR